MATLNDVILIYLEDAPISFARVESILPDPKKGWFQIRLLMLQIPLQAVTWILKDAYINGEEFQMNGKRMRLEKIHAPKETPAFSRDTDTNQQETAVSKTNNIISFADLKKNHEPPAN